MLKLNLGSHNKRVEGYKNVDALKLDNVDIVHDLTVFPYPFKDNSVDDIVMEEVLEHISFRKCHPVLSEIYRILKPKGKLFIQVPDCGKMMKYYAEDRICDCVPHKADSMEDFKPDDKCFKCGGRGRINPTRWFYSFTGAQKHEFDAHLNIFTKGTLGQQLEGIGFKNINFKNHLFKLKVKCSK